MTLELVFRTGKVPRRPLLLPQVAGSGIEAFTASLLGAAGGIRRLFPGPGQKASAAAIRRWHRDAWWALPETERCSMVLAAGSGAACLAPLVGERADIVAIVRDPIELLGAAAATGLKLPRPQHLHALANGDALIASRLRPVSNPQTRVLLAHREEFDDLPVTLGPPPDPAPWRALLFDETLPGIRAFRAGQLASEAEALARNLGCRREAIAQVVDEAETTLSGTPVRLEPDHVDLLCQLNWLDTELHEHLTPPRPVSEGPATTSAV